MGTISVITRMKVKKGVIDVFLKNVQPFLTETHKESGCVLYDVYQNTQEKSFIIFHEVWTGQPAINSHISSAHFGDFMAKSASLLESMEPGSQSPFQVTIAAPFDPAHPPVSERVIVASRTKAKAEVLGRIAADMEKSILAPSNREAGCAGYDLFQNISDKQLFILFEQWKGFSAIQAHMGTKHFADFMSTAPASFMPPVAGAKDIFEVMICSPYQPV